jgi:4-amino-4-deoxy-L-arabinose transferase-like glycosyltransferase
MLTYNEKVKPKRKDRPWLLVVLVLIWVFGTAFFHSPWEPYEPFVLSVVKSILRNNSWLVPYVSHLPYLEIQPFYFWLYAAILKLLHVSNIYSIANGIRLINTSLILAVIALCAKVGANLSAFKNGRSVVLILISSVGFVNLSYQISPNIIVILGFCLYLYALQLHRELPGISGWLLFTGLLLISISFSSEFILIALFILILLPLIDKHWRNRNFFMTAFISVTLFSIIFYSYCYGLQQVDKDFFWQWKIRYMEIYHASGYNILRQLKETLLQISWFLVPGSFLVIWTIYKRKLSIFKDKIIQVNIILAIMLFLFSVFSGRDVDQSLFPIILPFVFIASLEIDSIRITIVSLLNWFSIFIFGTFGAALWTGYILFNLNMPYGFINYALQLTQDFHYQFSSWQLMLAILITFIWLFMITRRGIRGREVVSNWASGTTFVLVLFMALWLPWFDSVLTFRPLVEKSLKYINPKICTVTNGSDTVQGALWYYYADINLLPSFLNLNFNVCNQALVAVEDINSIDQNMWNVMWQGKRPIDKKTYVVIHHK